jgi:hypothetical protein
MLPMRKTLLFLCALCSLCAVCDAQQASVADATVHFYRYKQYVGSLLKPSIYCDGAEVGRIQNGTVFDVRLSPGPHTFYAEDKQAGAVVTLEPGKEYFFRTDLQTGFWKGHFRLTMMMPEQGAFDVAKLKPTLTDH